MRFHKRRHQSEPELDLIPFLNVMVVLIAFLLVNAVFSAVAVLDVNLPAQASAAQQKDQKDKPKVALEVMIYDNYLLVNDRNTGPLKRFPNIDGKPDVNGLHQYMVKLKQRVPDTKKITLLSQDDTSYQLLISIMDAVRYRPEKVAGHEIRRPLFPSISIGSAPPRSTSAVKGGA